MKKILFSLVIIGVISSISFFVTRAYFSDKKTALGNTFSVGTLNLQVGDSNNSNAEPFSIAAVGTGETGGTKVWNVKNTGSLPGQFSAVFDNLINYENGCNDAEKTIDTTCDNPGKHFGELGKYIKATFYLNDVKKVETILTEDTAANITNLWASLNPPLVLEPGEEQQLRMDWQLDPNYNNEIQSDSLTFDINFNLKQISK
jgi:hypothetical protein